jgi:GNAT superfamily N-acetyltransferase
MTGHVPDGVSVTFDADPGTELRGALARGINAFHAATVPQDSRRFAFMAEAGNALAGGIVGVLAWEWLFVEALFVADAWRGQGLGQALLARAEAHAALQGCHSAWLDTFQAKGFYERAGYRAFGSLPQYPAGQVRWFMRKGLRAPA